MITRIFFAFFIWLSSTAVGQSYSPVDAGSKVKFIIKNFGIATSGTFQGLSGSIIFDPLNLAAAAFAVSVKSKTVNTDIEARDNHLRKTEYFDVENFPEIFLKSVKISKTNKAEYLYMFGNLTIKGVTKEVKFPFSFLPKDGGYLFEGEFEINRRDFGVGGKSFSMSDKLKVVLSVFATK